VFRVGINQQIEMVDCGRVCLEANQQVTFITSSGKEHDFAAKGWGFYATPSINGRLRDQGFRTALVRSALSGRYFVLVIEQELMAEFHAYLEAEKLVVAEWLDERA
jgi:hypothetical protein